jgi:Fe-S oxidoreductase
MADTVGLSPRILATMDAYDLRRLGGAVQYCLSCGACEERCPQNVQFVDYIRGLRELTPTGARMQCPHGEALHSAAWMMAGAKEYKRDMSWLDEDLKVADKGEVAFFVGCTPLFDVMYSEEHNLKTVEISNAAIRMLNQLGIEPVVLAEERCCGHDQLWNGEPQAFKSLAEANISLYKERGVKHILTTCAECMRTWKMDYAEAAPHYKPKVQHFSEFIAEQVDKGKLKFEENGANRVTFHDPCRLAHHQGQIQAPRQVLQALPGTDNVEMEHAGRNAYCCGTAGFIYCDAASRQLQEERLAEAEATGAQKMLTACPKCLIHLTCAQTGAKRRGSQAPVIEVKDLTVFAAERLKKSDKAKSQEAGEAS